MVGEYSGQLGSELAIRADQYNLWHLLHHQQSYNVGGALIPASRGAARLRPGMVVLVAVPIQLLLKLHRPHPQL